MRHAAKMGCIRYTGRPHVNASIFQELMQLVHKFSWIGDISAAVDEVDRALDSFEGGDRVRLSIDEKLDGYRMQFFQAFK